MDRQGKGEQRRPKPWVVLICSLFVLTPCAFSADYSGVYRCEFAGDMNEIWYVVLEQNGVSGTAVLGESCAFPMSVQGNRVTIVLDGPGQMILDFDPEGGNFSGTWQYGEESGTVTGERVDYEEWSVHFYDIDQNGVPQFVETDFSELHKISEISRFRSGAGHDYSDCFESCRSMKHYYYASPIYRENQNLQVFSPVEGVLESIRDERHGSSEGLTNKQVRIRSLEYPAFIFVLFHVDPLSSDIAEGALLQAGQLLGHAHLYYPDLDEVAPGFDIAVQVSTPSGQRYVSYFDTMTDSLFSQYVARGVGDRMDLIISQAERDADALTCDGEAFLTTGTIENWFTLGPPVALYDWNGDGFVSIVGDVPPFVNCVYFQTCPIDTDTVAVGDCNDDGFLSIVGDVPRFVDCVYFNNCPQ